MTPPTPSAGGSLGRVTSSPRVLAVWVMLALASLTLIFTFLSWVFPAGPVSFATRSTWAFDGFVNILTVALPVLAVLLAVHVEPVLPNGRLVASVALILYAVVLFFGVVTLLIGLGDKFDINYSGSAIYSFGRALEGLRYLVVGLVELALAGVAGLVSYQTYTALGGRLPTGGRPLS